MPPSRGVRIRTTTTSSTGSGSSRPPTGGLWGRQPGVGTAFLPWMAGTDMPATRMPRSSSSGGLAHWNGRRWRSFAPPTAFDTPDQPAINDVVSISPTDAWAVGSVETTTGADAITDHWTGRRWQVVANPGTGSDGRWNLTAVDARSPEDVWTVGEGGTGTDSSALTMHWDGSSWSILPTPNVPTTVPRVTGGFDSDYLTDVAVVSPRDVWAVGWHDRAGVGRPLLLAERWDGSRWRVVTTPTYLGGHWLNAVTASSRNDVWAVGSSFIPDAEIPYVMHWDGSSWTGVVGCRAGTLSRLSSAGSVHGDLTAVGFFSKQEQDRSLGFVERISTP
jgi:hypothetical protein